MTEIRIGIEEMKILHTSDIHLMNYYDERWNALIKLLEIGKQEKIELFIISGDLFDKNVAADELRPKIRNIFSNNSFKIIILPGNHDSESYKSGYYFGHDVIILNDLEKPYEYQNLRIWGFPYENIEGEKVLDRISRIKHKLTEDKANILLYHGELIDAFFARNDFGEEGEKRYMPIKLSYFDDLNIDYILAGHFHSKFDVWQLSDNKYFVYPSSPVSITKKEVGFRKINLFEVGKPPYEYILDTPYYENINIKFDPIEDLNPLEKVAENIEDTPAHAKICLKIDGYLNCAKIGTNEEDLTSDLRDMFSSRCHEINFEFKDISTILEDELFLKFFKKLKDRSYNELRENQMKELLIKGMMGLNR